MAGERSVGGFVDGAPTLIGSSLSDFGDIPLGYIREEIDKTYGVKKYMLVQRDTSAVTSIVGHVYTFVTGANFVATNDISDSSVNRFAGVGVSIPTSTNLYFWVQVKGYCPTVLGDGSIADGELLVPHASTDGSAETFSANHEHEVFGRAVGADSGTPTVFAAVLFGNRM